MRTEFTYTESDEVIYCRRCGQIAGGAPTKCTHNYTSHDFARAKRAMICKRCGVSIGRATICTNNYVSHDFAPLPA